MPALSARFSARTPTRCPASVTTCPIAAASYAVSPARRRASQNASVGDLTNRRYPSPSAIASTPIGSLADRPGLLLLLSMLLLQSRPYRRYAVPLPALVSKSASGDARSPMLGARCGMLGLRCSPARAPTPPPRISSPVVRPFGRIAGLDARPSRLPTARSLLHQRSCPVVLLQLVVELASLLGQLVKQGLDVAYTDLTHHADL